MDELFIYIAGLVILLSLSAFFSGSEAALYSLSRPRIRALREKSAAGRLIGALLEKPRKLLVTILLGNLLVNIFTTSTATAMMNAPIPPITRAKDRPRTIAISALEYSNTVIIVSPFETILNRLTHGFALRRQSEAARRYASATSSAWASAC